MDILLFKAAGCMMLERVLHHQIGSTPDSAKRG